ncbi:LacI family DNA-binding transcriptional regulator [Dinoroseobacter sp. S76]|uniref:LacI family DNA-binding transcriptional regulator n=1 Tax=Dinoroseobacter sp. S76 TaxID=3415124 RepID=UPI003C7EBBC6
MTEGQGQKPPARKAGSDAPTLQDVAQAAGVSTATVSRCLNMPERVVKDTRERVLAVVEKLGYAPNFGARALAAKRTNTIGAIIPTMENAIFARGLQAFQEELARHGLTLLVASSSYQPELEREQIRTLLARGADALLLIGFERAASVYELLDQRSVPYVIAWAFDETAQHPAIGFDNREAMRALARQVFELGHRDVAIITAPLAPNDRARDRVSGVWDAAREVGLCPDEITLIETPYSIENGAAAMEDLLGQKPRPTAVMCGNDVLAVGAMGQAQSMGLSVPGDISITGFDDIEIAGIVTPALTTVHVPHRQMGKEAAQVLSDLLGGATAGAPVRLQTEIMSRASLGPVPREDA